MYVATRRCRDIIVASIIRCAVRAAVRWPGDRDADDRACRSVASRSDGDQPWPTARANVNDERGNQGATLLCWSGSANIPALAHPAGLGSTTSLHEPGSQTPLLLQVPPRCEGTGCTSRPARIATWTPS